MTPSHAFLEMAGAARVDFVVADLEHGELDLSLVAGLCRTALAHRLPLLVRVPDREASTVARVLDRGVAGIIVPKVERVEQAQAIAAAARYAPAGARGVAIGAIRASAYGFDGQYRTRSQIETAVILQLESRSGLEAAAEIAAVRGVDMVFFGPNDLAAELGLDGVDDPALWREIDKTRGRLPQGTRLGTIATPRRSAVDLAAEGYQLVIEGSDLAAFRMFLKGCAAS